jgi:hypothetical protein
MAIMKDRYFGFRGGWLTFWLTVACGTDMSEFRSTRRYHNDIGADIYVPAQLSLVTIKVHATISRQRYN